MKLPYYFDRHLRVAEGCVADCGLPISVPDSLANIFKPCLVLEHVLSSSFKEFKILITSETPDHIFPKSKRQQIVSMSGKTGQR